MSARPPDPRLMAAAGLLRELGLPADALRAEGHEGEIAALRVPASHWARLLGEAGASLGARLRELGFRYTALDLDAPGEG